MVPSDALFMESMFKADGWWCRCNKLLLQLNIVPRLALVLAASQHVKEAALADMEKKYREMGICVPVCLKNRYNI